MERDVCVPFLVVMAAVTHQMFEEVCKRSYIHAHGVVEHTLALKRADSSARITAEKQCTKLSMLGFSCGHLTHYIT